MLMRQAMSSPTPIFTTPPTVMFVGADAGLADTCGRAMPAVQLLRVGNAAGAVQRMVVMRPLVVIVDDSVPPEHRVEIEACARDIRGGFVDGTRLSTAALTEAITSAALDSERRREIDPLPPPPVEEDD